MKTELTTEQSQHLIELGVPANKASMTSNQLHGDPYYNDYYQCIFTLTDLLEILPKEIGKPYAPEDKENLVVFWLDDVWTAAYAMIREFYAEELIDALYELTVWCIENGHLKF